MRLRTEPCAKHSLATCDLYGSGEKLGLQVEHWHRGCKGRAELLRAAKAARAGQATTVRAGLRYFSDFAFPINSNRTCGSVDFST